MALDKLGAKVGKLCPQKQISWWIEEKKMVKNVKKLETLQLKLFVLQW